MRGRGSPSGRPTALVGAFFALVVLALALPAGVAAGAPSTPSGTCSWSISTNRVHAVSGTLESVDALSPRDAWAVGSVQMPRRARPLAEHWNGKTWQVVPTPADGRHVRILHDVLALASDDVWAVGSQILVKTGVVHTLIEHWDGAGWSIVPSPRARSGHEELLAVSGGAADNLWAVGYLEPQITPLPLAMHWNGTRWHVTRAPAGGILQDVSAHHDGGVWAVGSSAPGVRHALLAMHARAGWHVDPNAPAQDLEAIAWRRPYDAWAVGDAPASPPVYLQPLAMHWNGSSWSFVPTPALQQSAELRGVAAISSDRAWAVGTLAFTHPLMLRWDGKAWHLATPPTGNGYLQAVTRVPGTEELWAVGHGAPDPLIFRYC